MSQKDSFSPAPFLDDSAVNEQQSSIEGSSASFATKPLVGSPNLPSSSLPNLLPSPLNAAMQQAHATKVNSASDTSAQDNTSNISSQGTAFSEKLSALADPAQETKQASAQKSIDKKETDKKSLGKKEAGEKPKDDAEQDKTGVQRQIYVPLHSLDDESVISPFRHALVLGKDTSLRALDRTALRLAGVRRVNCLGSGEEAITMLSQRGRSRWVPLFDVIVCDMQLLDMTAYEFLEQVRDVVKKENIPVFLVSPAPSRHVVLSALSQGISGFVTRPYTPSTLVTQLEIAYNVVKSKKIDLAQASHAMLCEHEILVQQAGLQVEKRQLTPEVVTVTAITALDEARQLVEKGDFNQAIAKLEQNLENPDFVAESCAELAKIWEAKGNKAEAQHYRELAYDLYVGDKKWTEAQEVQEAMENTTGESSKKAIVDEIGALIKQGRYDEAAPIVAAVKKSPKALDTLLQQISRACQLMPVPQRAIENLVAALGRINETEYGKKLHVRLLGEAPQEEASAVDDRGFFERTFPTLHAVAAIASYTAKSYKKNKDSTKI